MNVWLLIIITTTYTHGADYQPSVITFQEFNSQARCEQMATWVNTNFKNKTNQSYAGNTSAQCVPKDNK